MSNPYSNYYNNQAGSGLSGFQGVRYQRGHGFFGRMFSGLGNFVKDLAPGLFKRALPSAIGLAQDVLAGENVGKSAKKRLIEAGKNVADETIDKIKTKIQGGSGIPRKRRKRMQKFRQILVNRKTKANKRNKRKKKR